MESVRYLTPEWVEESLKAYHSDPSHQERLKKLTTRMCYRIKADPSWGIEKDIMFGTFFDKGKLTKMDYFTEEDAWSANVYDCSLVATIDNRPIFPGYGEAFIDLQGTLKDAAIDFDGVTVVGDSHCQRQFFGRDHMGLACFLRLHRKSSYKPTD